MSTEHEFKLLNNKMKTGEATETERTRWSELKAEFLAGQTENEKRKHQRANIAIDVVFTNDDELLRAVCWSLGAGGIGIELDGEFPIDAEHDIRLTLPNIDSPVLVRVRVAWTGGGRVGFEFLNLPNEVKDHIDALVWEEVDVSDL